MFLPLIFSALSASASPNIDCLLTETQSNQEFETPFSISIDANGKGLYQISQSQNGMTSGYFQVKEPQAVWTLVDPSTKKPFSTLVSSADQTENKVHFFTGDSSQDLMLECKRSIPMASIKIPKTVACQLVEISGSNRVEQNFMVPIASYGHDIFPLPKAQIAPLAGWILVYNGAIVSFLQNAKSFSGITLFGTWDNPTGISWYPSSENTKVILNCTPEFP